MTNDLFQPSSLDAVLLAMAVEEKFLDLSEAYLRIRGCPIPIPVTIQSAIVRWRQMRVRHKKVWEKARTNKALRILDNDNLLKYLCQQEAFTHTVSEEKAVKEIAQWTVDVNCELRNQRKKIVEFI